MKTREPILTRGRDNWDAINVPEVEFHGRVDRVREAMDAEGIDALVLYGTGDRDGDIAYLSNLVHKVPGFPLAFVLTRESAVVLNQRSSRTRPVVERSTWVDDVRFTRNLWSSLDDILAELTGAGAEVGFVGADATGYPDHEALQALGRSWTIKIRDGFLDDVRAIKSEREQDQIRRSGRVLRDVDHYLSNEMEAPIGERRIEAELDRFARLNGAQDVRVLLSNPEQTESALRPPEDHPITGDVPVSFYLAARFEGYWSALGRTYLVGDDDPQPSGFSDVRDAYDAFTEPVGPGEDTGSVIASLRDQLNKRNLELDTPYPLGNGIGLELDEPPALGADGGSDTVEFAAGMAMELTLVVRTAGSKPMVLGDTVIVNDDGIDFCTR